MIIPNLSEEKILEELIFDRKIVANEAKKVAKKAIARFLKEGRDGYDREYVYPYHIKTTKNQNRWFCLISVNMANKPKWYHRAVCITEAQRGTKNYYFVRGFSNNSPYFIRVTAHALKRFRERAIEQRNQKESNVDSEFFTPYLFETGEVITCMQITDPKYFDFLLESEDKHIITTLFYTHMGCYLGNKTDHGNYEFRTCLNQDKMLKSFNENVALIFCKYAHAGNNQKLYSKSYIESIKNSSDPDLQNLKDLDGYKDLHDYRLVP